MLGGRDKGIDPGQLYVNLRSIRDLLTEVLYIRFLDNALSLVGNGEQDTSPYLRLVVAKTVKRGISVILYYDHLITLDDEVKYMWSKPLSKPSLFFFVNRYFAFIAVSVRS